jgi:hypothetical protein
MYQNGKKGLRPLVNIYASTVTIDAELEIASR